MLAEDLDAKYVKSETFPARQTVLPAWSVLSMFARAAKPGTLSLVLLRVTLASPANFGAFPSPICKSIYKAVNMLTP